MRRATADASAVRGRLWDNTRQRVGPDRRNVSHAGTDPEARRERVHPADRSDWMGTGGPKTRRPFAVVVSISAPAPASTRRPTPRSRSSSTVLTKCFRSRPSRSSFHTTNVFARLQRLQAGIEARTMILASRGAVFVDALCGDASVNERVALQVQKLASIRL